MRRSKAKKTLPLIWWQSDKKREEGSSELTGRWPETREEEISGGFSGQFKLA
jgi:hypothetical protein